MLRISEVPVVGSQVSGAAILASFWPEIETQHVHDGCCQDPGVVSANLAAKMHNRSDQAVRVT